MKKKMKKSDHAKVVKHLKGDMAGYSKEIKEDKELIKNLSHKKAAKPAVKKVKEKEKHAKKEMGKKRSDLKFDKVLHEFKERKLHSGSKKGPVVTKPSQATAIAFSEARRAYKKKKK